MTDTKTLLSAILFAPLLSLGACQQSTEPPGDPSSDDPAATRPSGSPSLLTVEGRIESGVECRVLHTPDGKRYAFNGGDEFASGDYVRITGELADASFCQEGEGTLVIDSIESADAPARDRDPARAGGVALTEDYVIGSWTAKGVDANCAKPDFQISRSPGALVLESSVNGVPTDSMVVLGDYPRLVLDDPLPDLPLESRGPDGMAILRPATDAAYDPVSIGGHRIVGDGVVFVKCGN